MSFTSPPRCDEDAMPLPPLPPEFPVIDHLKEFKKLEVKDLKDVKDSKDYLLWAATVKRQEQTEPFSNAAVTIRQNSYGKYMGHRVPKCVWKRITTVDELKALEDDTELTGNQQMFVHETYSYFPGWNDYPVVPPTSQSVGAVRVISPMWVRNADDTDYEPRAFEPFVGYQHKIGEFDESKSVINPGISGEKWRKVTSFPLDEFNLIWVMSSTKKQNCYTRMFPERNEFEDD